MQLVASLSLVMFLAAPEPWAGESDAPAFVEKARAASAVGGGRAMRRLAASDRAAAYEAAHRLADGGAPEDRSLALSIARAYADAFRDSRLRERVEALARRTPAQREEHAQARLSKDSAKAVFAEGKLDEARGLYEEALRGFRAAGDLREEGRCLSNMGAASAALGDSDGALRLLDQAVAAVDRSGDLDLLAAIHINRAYALDDLGRQEEERAALLAAVEASRQMDDRPGAGRASLMLGGLDLKGGRLEEAERHTRSAVAAAREMEDPELESAAWFNLSRLDQKRGRAAAEERAMRRSREAARRGGFASFEADAALNLAAMARKRGDLAGARALIEQARAVAATTEDNALRSGVEYEEALLTMDSGRYADSQRFFDAAERWLEGTDFEGQRSAVHGARASALFYAGEYEEAIAYFRRSLEEAAAAGRADLQATYGASLGYLLSILGDTSAGMAEIEKAMRIREEIGDLVGRARDLDLVGALRFRAGDLAGARAVLEEAVKAIPREAARADRADAMKDLAEVELASGPERREAALDLLAEARSEFETLGDLEGVIHANVLLARAALDAGDAEEARWALARAEGSAHGRRTAQHGWMIPETEGRLLEARGDRDGAVRAYRRAVAEVERLRGSFRREAWRAAFLEDRVSPYRALVRIHLERGEVEEAWSAARAAKARTLVERLAPPVLAASVATAPARPPASLLPSQPIAASRLRSLIGEREVLLDFFRGDAGWSVFVLGGGGLVHRLLAAKPGTIEPLIEAARYPGRPGSGDYAVTAAWRAACRRLGSALFSEVGDLLDGADHLLVVPSGALHGVPFAALEIDGRRLVERWSLSILPASEALATRAERTRRTRAALLAVGDPAGAPDVALPGAVEEVHAVASASGGRTVKLMGAQALESEVRLRAPEFDRIHVAAHALLDRLTPARSYIALAAGGGQDGRWEAAEIASSRLGASLVVLSGCETAVDLGWAGGEAPADERIGIARAFLAGGAAAVVAGLWEVDDRASRWVMQALHAKLSTMAPGPALASVQRDLIAGRVRDGAGQPLDHPFYWAGLVAYGAGTGASGARAAGEERRGGEGGVVLVREEE